MEIQPSFGKTLCEGDALESEWSTKQSLVAIRLISLPKPYGTSCPQARFRKTVLENSGKYLQLGKPLSVHGGSGCSSPVQTGPNNGSYPSRANPPPIWCKAIL